jgi:hypothetical protein
MSDRQDMGVPPSGSGRREPSPTVSALRASVPNTEPQPCPFCATEMHRHKHCFSHPRPASGDCVLRHYSFDNNKISKWNTRNG